MNETQKSTGDTLDNGACTPKNHANNPENCTVLENGGTLGHMRIVRGGGIDIKGFLSSLCDKKSAKPSDTPSLVDVPPCTPAPSVASTEQRVSQENLAQPVQFLSLQAVAHAAIEQAEPSPAIQQRLKAQYARTLQAYGWITDLSERHQYAMNYLDEWLIEGYGQRIALDGTCDDAGAFRVTSWRLVPCDKPQTATPDAPVHAKATTTTATLPGMGRAV